MKTFVISFLALLSISSTAFSEESTAQFTYWYQTPTNPDDGNTVRTPVAVASYSENEKTAKYVLELNEVSADFAKLGGWMSEIVSIEGKIDLIPESQKKKDSYYGASKQVAVITFKDGSTREESIKCLQEYSDRRFYRCYFSDGNNSFDLWP